MSIMLIQGRTKVSREKMWFVHSMVGKEGAAAILFGMISITPLQFSFIACGCLQYSQSKSSFATLWSRIAANY